jgi:hypothetical protein
MKSSRLARAPQDVVFGQALFIEFLHWPSVMQQSVGILGMLDTYLWGPAYPLWQYPVGALLLVALVVGSGLDRARLLIVTGGTVAVATISEMATKQPRVRLAPKAMTALPTLRLHCSKGRRSGFGMEGLPSRPPATQASRADRHRGRSPEGGSTADGMAAGQGALMVISRARRTMP